LLYFRPENKSLDTPDHQCTLPRSGAWCDGEHKLLMLRGEPRGLSRVL
jgi:hypothetical protein